MSGILLVIFAILDLVLVTKLPFLNSLLAISQTAASNRNQQLQLSRRRQQQAMAQQNAVDELHDMTTPDWRRAPNGEGDDTNTNRGDAGSPTNALVHAIVGILGSMFTYICLLLTAIRCIVFSIVSQQILTSGPEVWGAVDEASKALVETHKIKVVLGYAVLEAMFSIWVSFFFFFYLSNIPWKCPINSSR